MPFALCQTTFIFRQTNNPGNRRGDSEGGRGSEGWHFVATGDDAALAKGILDLKEDAQRRKNMGIFARKYAIEHFDRLKQAREFIDLVCGFTKKAE